MSKKFDVIIIGAGNAGFGVSSIVHDAGKSIAFIEERDFGGTCPNRGCTPKKILVAAAHAMHEIENASTHAIDVAGAKLDWAKLIDREQDMVSPISGMMEGLAEKRGTVFRGRAKFTGPNTVEVNGEELWGENIVIATGSKPRPLAIPGAEHLITSDEVLSERELPREVIFIGGGVIAMEFAHVYARAGAKVTILEALPRLLPRLDQDAVAALHTATERLGVVIKTGVKVLSISKADGKLTVEYEHEGTIHTQSATRVVNGTGRIAQVEGLNLEAANVKHDGIRIELDNHLRSVSNPAVWVAGDALLHSAQLSPIATYEGRIVGQNILEGPTVKPEYNAIPSSVYTVPALSSVGLTEEQAEEIGRNIKVVKADMSGWFSSRTYGETAGFAKTIVDADSDEIIGAHLMGHQGEELIHLFALAMKQDIPASALRDGIFSFPTFSADIKSML